MNLLKTFQEKYTKKSLPELKSGDVVRVHEKIREGKKERIQIFEGIIIAIHDGKSLDASFTARKISFGVGVEKIFPLHLPTIIKIESGAIQSPTVETAQKIARALGVGIDNLMK